MNEKIYDALHTGGGASCYNRQHSEPGMVSGNSKWEMSGKLTAMEHRSQLPKQMEGVSLMRRLTPLLIRSLVATLFVGMAGQLPASIVTTPTDLNPGDEYRLVFLTSGTRSALSTSIDDYNFFVKSLGDVAVVSDWKAIASTATVDAIDNTGTTGGGGVPIYNLVDQLVAEDYDDLWDGSILNSIHIDENGSSSYQVVWTGTGVAGAAIPDYFMGSGGNAINGSPYYKHDDWVSAGDIFTVGSYLRMYGMSSVLTVPTEPVPEPASVITWTLLGIVGCIGTWWNRRRKAG